MSQLQRLDNRWSALRHLVTGLLFGFLLGIRPSIESPWFAAMDWVSLTLFSGFVGLLVWLCRCGVAQHREAEVSRRSRRNRKRHGAWGELRTEEPRAYRGRLAQFLHCEEADLNGPRTAPVSRMKFWCLMDEFERTRPKPTWLIRRLLHRIRALVRGGDV